MADTKTAAKSASPKTGRCPGCGYMKRLDKNGRIAGHTFTSTCDRRYGQQCPGKGQLPRPSQIMGLDDDDFALADQIERVMSTEPVGHMWTPSELGRKIPGHPSSGHIRHVLMWMEKHVLVTHNDRGGAWRRWGRRY